VERVAFLIEGSGQRIDCLLNPETLEVTRLAGIRPRTTATGALVGANLTDDPLLFTGGGRTELVLDLVFDVDLVESSGPDADVRALTRPLWQLAENSAEERGSVRPPLARLVWGKTWNVLGVVAAVAERFDSIGSTGVPRRSWLRLKLVRVTDSPTDTAEDIDSTGRAGTVASHRRPGAVQATGDGHVETGFGGVRFDLLAEDALGSPHRWRELAEHNDISNPLTVDPGTVLSVPPSAGGRS